MIFPRIEKLRTNRPSQDLSIELTNFIFIDIETNGLRPDRGAKINEIALLNRNQVILTWKENGDTVQSILPILIDYLKKGVVVGHNLSFDFWFIFYEANRVGIEGPVLQFIDTLALAKRIVPYNSSFRLNILLKMFDIKVEGNLHSAIIDAEATRALFWALIGRGNIATVGEAGIKNLYWV